MLAKNQKITIEEDDAPDFIEIVNTIMEHMIFHYDIGEVVFVKIKNFFDHKWLNYSGYTLVPTGSWHADFDIAKKDVWRDKISIPPFNPNRVVYSNFFRIYVTNNPRIEKKIHRFRLSSNNIHNRVENYTSDGLLVWFSSNTEFNQKGSLMIYRSQNNEVQTWYARIENTNGWKIIKTKGIKLDELADILIFKDKLAMTKN